MIEDRNSCQDSSDIRYLVRVMVIDDSKVDSEFLSEILQSFGCRVDVSSNGYDAVNKLDKHYDLVFLDINMPEISGLEIANGLRNFNKVGHYTPIVLVSGEEFSQAMEDKCISLGVEGYIQKPVYKDEVETVLRTYLSGHEIKIFSRGNKNGNPCGFIKLNRKIA